MKTFKVHFDVSVFTQIPNTYLNSDMWIEFEVDNIDEAEAEAFRAIVNELINVQHNVLKKVELLKIQELEDGEIVQTRTFKELEEDEY